jgi:glycosyltransferase involved in cell wall biosynthesis
LQSHNANDESKEHILRKIESFKDLDITIVAPSKWIAELASQSTVFKNRRIEIIRTGVDSSQFKPLLKSEMRKAFSISENATLVLFGADSVIDPRKGIKLLIDSLKILKQSGINNLELGIFGNGYNQQLYDLGFTIHNFGFLNNFTLPVIYNCADVFVAPSIQENLPNTALEAMACGVPVCGFNIGGMPDLITNNFNGSLAYELSSEALASSILNTLSNPKTMGENARMTICNNFTQEQGVNNYLNLFNSLV